MDFMIDLLGVYCGVDVEVDGYGVFFDVGEC